MRTWNKQLYLGPMPGTEAPLDDWLADLQTHEIEAVVCLNPEDEVQYLSPEYYRWRQHPSTTQQFQLIDVPIEDGDIPKGIVVQQFWDAVDEVKQLITNGKSAFIHCTAGRGRTGTFGVAVLLKMGYSLIDAGTEMYNAGSYAETTVQEEFLEGAYQAMASQI